MALYHKIAEFIMEKIKTEEWKKGQLIPSEKEFCEQFQVSRPTVRAAIAYLANQGYLVTVKGKGNLCRNQRLWRIPRYFWRASARKWQQRVSLCRRKY